MCSLFERGKCLSISCKKSRAILVLTFVLILVLILLSLFTVRRCKVVRLRRTFLNLLHDNLLIRLFIGEGNCRVIEGGWLDKRLIYSGSSFGFRYGLFRWLSQMLCQGSSLSSGLFVP